MRRRRDIEEDACVVKCVAITSTFFLATGITTLLFAVKRWPGSTVEEIGPGVHQCSHDFFMPLPLSIKIENCNRTPCSLPLVPTHPIRYELEFEVPFTAPQLYVISFYMKPYTGFLMSNTWNSIDVVCPYLNVSCPLRQLQRVKFQYNDRVPKVLPINLAIGDTVILQYMIIHPDVGGVFCFNVPYKLTHGTITPALSTTLSPKPDNFMRLLGFSDTAIQLLKNSTELKLGSLS